MSDEVHKLMCMPADQPQGIPGSVKVKGDCGHQIWIAPSGFSLVLSPAIETQTVCLRCVDPEEVKEAVKNSRMREAPGAREELAREVGEEQTDNLFKALRIKGMGES